MQYKQTLNRIAYQVLRKQPELPEHYLMIGEAEYLDDVPLVIPQKTISKYIAQNVADMSSISNEQLQAAIQNNMLEINDANGNTAILAGVLGGASK